MQDQAPKTVESTTGTSLDGVINTVEHPLSDSAYRARSKAVLDRHGVLVLKNFLTAAAVDDVRREGKDNQYLAYYTSGTHTSYLSPVDPAYPAEHPRNRMVTSSKGCITTDQIPADSVLRRLYASDVFKDFLCQVLAEEALYEYADPLSSINLHYAAEGQELGWHYDNSSFAITLLIQQPAAGGEFEYIKNARNAAAGDMAFEYTGKILDGEIPASGIEMNEGTLVLFRGRDSIHRVTPTVGDITRMLVVLAYNNQPDVSLSESARMTFYGRLG